ncbi:BlaI/MecI/CopY family transcriptional regulator [Streptomyces sp. W16]|uniref:BlaI/MecI/CopY family transcriptional regulator n=1 Tax=Streptomyces sp. W16 TaxID=3076631 RepID=UPI00295BC2A4|nr:BlaI/MecI/CopY family transcriptional regulator [Streptomyces sp. W16]MDV9176248.1 BlaI/MecI/CopY family transcriptional regulator [Streptomyces sp. W16]
MSGSESEPSGIILGPLASEVMRVLWRTDHPLTPHAVRDVLNRSRSAPLAYTTVMTVLARLWERGAASRVKQGRSYAYTPAVANEATLAVRSVLRSYGAAAVAPFVEEARNNPEILARLEKLVRRFEDEGAERAEGEGSG